MTPEQMASFADITSSAGIMVIMFFFLRDMARNVKGLSDSVIKMEARGDVITRGPTENG